MRCWAEAIAPVKVALRQLPSLVLLVSEDTAGLIDLAAELVRLGCERQELLVTDRVGVARVVDPPTYTIVRALDRDHGLRVYAPDPPGQDATWCELGYRHPLADRLRAERGTLLLVGPERWRVVPDNGWLSVDAALELVVPGDRALHQAMQLPARRRVPLRLAGGRRGVASLWVIRNDAIAAIDKLLATLPDEVVARLSCAATSGNEPTVLIRARGGRSAPPDLSLVGAEAYAPLNQMPDVYAPAGAIVEPPLRRERLRQVLAVGTNEVMWLAPRRAARPVPGWSASPTARSRRCRTGPSTSSTRARPRSRRGCARRSSTSRRSCRPGGSGARRSRRRSRPSRSRSAASAASAARWRRPSRRRRVRSLAWQRRRTRRARRDRRPSAPAAAT